MSIKTQTIGAAVFCALATGVTAEQSDIISEIGAAERIEVADELRTLTQMIASAACHLHALVEADRSKAQLHKAIDGFDARLLALRDGDPDHGIIEPEKDHSTLRHINALHDLWMPMMDAAKVLLENPSDVSAAHVIYDGTPELFEESNTLMVHITGEYSNPVELLASDALLLDIVGQQAMNTQRIAYEACRVGSRTADQELTTDLEETAAHFEKALVAMRDGLPDLNVPPAPTPEIAEHLEQAFEDWADIKAITDHLVAHQHVALDQRASLFDMMNQKMESMQELTHLYVDYSKRTLR